jgi:hypothetical protein
VGNARFAQLGALTGVLLRYTSEQYSAVAMDHKDRRILLFLRGKSVFILTPKSDPTKTLEREKIKERKTTQIT